jgi:hypothetical protein
MKRRLEASSVGRRSDALSGLSVEELCRLAGLDGRGEWVGRRLLHDHRLTWKVREAGLPGAEMRFRKQRAYVHLILSDEASQWSRDLTDSLTDFIAPRPANNSATNDKPWSTEVDLHPDAVAFGPPVSYQDNRTVSRRFTVDGATLSFRVRVAATLAWRTYVGREFPTPDESGAVIQPMDDSAKRSILSIMSIISENFARLILKLKPSEITAILQCQSRDWGVQGSSPMICQLRWRNPCHLLDHIRQHVAPARGPGGAFPRMFKLTRVPAVATVEWAFLTAKQMGDGKWVLQHPGMLVVDLDHDPTNSTPLECVWSSYAYQTWDIQPKPLHYPNSNCHFM